MCIRDRKKAAKAEKEKEKREKEGSGPGQGQRRGGEQEQEKQQKQRTETGSVVAASPGIASNTGAGVVGSKKSAQKATTNAQGQKASKPNVGVLKKGVARPLERAAPVPKSRPTPRPAPRPAPAPAPAPAHVPTQPVSASVSTLTPAPVPTPVRHEPLRRELSRHELARHEPFRHESSSEGESSEEEALVHRHRQKKALLQQDIGKGKKDSEAVKLSLARQQDKDEDSEAVKPSLARQQGQGKSTKSGASAVEELPAGTEDSVLEIQDSCPEPNLAAATAASAADQLTQDPQTQAEKENLFVSPQVRITPRPDIHTDIIDSFNDDSSFPSSQVISGTQPESSFASETSTQSFVDAGAAPSLEQKHSQFEPEDVSRSENIKSNVPTITSSSSVHTFATPRQFPSGAIIPDSQSVSHSDSHLPSQNRSGQIVQPQSQSVIQNQRDPLSSTETNTEEVGYQPFIRLLVIVFNL